MWALLDLLVNLFSLGSWNRKPGQSPPAGVRLSKEADRRLEAARWLIYAVIGFGVAVLILIGVTLLLVN
jgi:hypothetical protein